MRTINNGITRIQNAVEDTFFDECSINHFSGLTYSGIDTTKVYELASGISCGYQVINGTTNYRGEIIVSEIDAKVRVPKDTQITVMDEVVITKKNGVSVNLLYKVDAVLAGISCITANLKNLES